MRKRHRQPLLRQFIATSALAATLGFVVLGLSQCRGMDDPMGVSVRPESATSNGISECVQHCNDLFKHCRDQENARYRQAVQKCNKLTTQPQRDACLAAEAQLHERNLNACAAAMDTCKVRCHYREGSGSGGR